MTALPPDPDPETTRGLGLEPGGGVRPGETPPDSGSTVGSSHDPPQRSRAGAVITLVLVALVVIAVVGFIIADIGGYLDVF